MLTRLCTGIRSLHTCLTANVDDSDGACRSAGAPLQSKAAACDGKGDCVAVGSLDDGVPYIHHCGGLIPDPGDGVAYSTIIEFNDCYKISIP